MRQSLLETGIRLTALITGLSAALVWVFATDAEAVEPREKPDVVLIISDDQTYRDFGFMGNKGVLTPNLDQLAAKSARYVYGYVPTSVCSPSLATLLTGRYPHENGIHYNHPAPGNAAFNRMTSREEYERVRGRSFYLIRSQPTLPRILAEHGGYRSLQTGKFWEGHFSNAGFTDGMTIFEPVPGQNYGGNRKLADGTLAAHGNGDWGLKIGRETMQPVYDFIEASTQESKPWLVWYAPYLPHQPHDSPKRFYDLYRDRPGVEPHEIPYYAAISQFDETVGELVTYIENKGRAEQTLFVFVVDNGWSPSRQPERSRPQEFAHTKESKRAPFDDGLRTPILLRWDGVTKPATHEELVSSIDLAPTILAACGQESQAKGMPGINLLPSARGERALDPDRAIFGELYPGDATEVARPSADIAYRWVRKGDYKLIAVHTRGGEKKPWGGYLDGDALYNVAEAPDENTNRIDEPALADTVKELRKLLGAWWTPGDDSAVPQPQAADGENP